MNYLPINQSFLGLIKSLILCLLLLGINVSMQGQNFTAPQEITCGDRIQGDNFNAANDYNKTLYNNSSNCNTNFTSNFNARDVEYFLIVPTSQEVTLKLSNLRKDLDLFLYKINANGIPTVCAAPASRNDNLASETIRTFLNAGTYMVIIDAYTPSQLSSYTLEVVCETPPQPDCCDNPLGQSWLKNIIDDICDDGGCTGEKIYCATYDGQPAIHITPWTTCTDGMGEVYDCNGNLLGRYGGFGGLQLPGTLRNIKLLWTTANCGDPCENVPTDCEEVSCTPRTPKTTESGNYSCTIDCSYTGDKRVRYWEVNGQRFNSTDKNPRFTANQPGKYTICTYFECDGRIYKCCTEVECPPIEDDCTNIPTDCEEVSCTPRTPKITESGNYSCTIDCSYTGGKSVRYWEVNGQRFNTTNKNTRFTANRPSKYTICTYFECDGRIYKCCREVECPTIPSNGDCDISDDFEGYSNGANISARNPSIWRKWNNNVRDGKASRDRAQSGNQSMEINRDQFGEQDIVLKLGNKSSGKYRVAWNMYINRNDQAYFNIQASQNNLAGGGVFNFPFRRNESTYQGKWLLVELFFDLDQNKLSMFIDGRNVAGGNYRTSLGGINFYAIEDAHFYIDNVCMQKINTFPFTDTDGADSRNSTAFSIEMTNTEIEKTPSLENKSLAENNELSVYPNPSKGFTTVKLNLAKAQAVQLNIINQTGQLVRTINVDNTQQIQQALDLSDLPNGLYFIKANGANLSMTQKLIIQR